jgi:hypothetical protein
MNNSRETKHRKIKASQKPGNCKICNSNKIKSITGKLVAKVKLFNELQFFWPFIIVSHHK